VFAAPCQFGSPLLLHAGNGWLSMSRVIGTLASPSAFLSDRRMGAECQQHRGIARAQIMQLHFTAELPAKLAKRLADPGGLSGRPIAVEPRMCGCRSVSSLFPAPQLSSEFPARRIKSLFGRINSLLGVKSFPVRPGREFTLRLDVKSTL